MGCTGANSKNKVKVNLPKVQKEKPNAHRNQKEKAKEDIQDAPKDDCIQEKCKTVLVIQLDNDPESLEEGKGEMRNAIETANLEMVKRILKDGYPINTPLNDKKTSILHLACSRGNVEILKCMINQGADINARDGIEWTPLILAASGGEFECAKHLLDAVK